MSKSFIEKYNDFLKNAYDCQKDKSCYSTYVKNVSYMVVKSARALQYRSEFYNCKPEIRNAFYKAYDNALNEMCQRNEEAYNEGVYEADMLYLPEHIEDDYSHYITEYKDEVLLDKDRKGTKRKYTYITEANIYETMNACYNYASSYKDSTLSVSEIWLMCDHLAKAIEIDQNYEWTDKDLQNNFRQVYKNLQSVLEKKKPVQKPNIWNEYFAEIVSARTQGWSYLQNCPEQEAEEQFQSQKRELEHEEEDWEYEM